MEHDVGLFGLEQQVRAVLVPEINVVRPNGDQVPVARGCQLCFEGRTDQPRRAGNQNLVVRLEIDWIHRKPLC